MIGLKEFQVKPSRIEGLGLFSLSPIAAGECIHRINVVREITPSAPLRKDLGERMDYCDYPDGKVVLLGFPDRHVNHCCDPNAYVRYEQDGCYLYARRAIAAGEEITVDYNINITDGTSWPCHCGAARCRGVVEGDFFKLPIEIQREYKPLLAEWFIRRNREVLHQTEKIMIHPLVSQLHFTRNEFVRCFEGVRANDARRRLEPLNCLSWAVGHLALQEHFYWVQLAQGKNIAAGLRERVGFRQPASTPPWDEMWDLWHTITRTADEYLVSLQPEDLDNRFVWEGKPVDETIGTLLLRNIYHYWFHLGKAHAIRQMMGHTNLAVYVGNVSTARYAPEK